MPPPPTGPVLRLLSLRDPDTATVSGPPACYYDFNLYSQKKTEEKLAYMHANPVRAGLVGHPCDWPWSSARYYDLGQTVGVPVGWPP